MPLSSPRLTLLPDDPRVHLGQRAHRPEHRVDLLQGVCRVCGCTDDAACEGGCYWVDETETLCSACAA